MSPRRTPLLTSRRALLALALASACRAEDPPAATGPAAAPRPPVSVAAVTSRPEARQPFFGDLHLHTTFSYDAWGMMGTRTTPEDAYRFAMGETVSYLGEPIRRNEPLDFMAVTDHSEYLGVLNQLGDEGSALSRSPVGREFLENPTGAFISLTRAMAQDATIPGLDPRPYLESTWKQTVKAANDYNNPGRFSTFIGYEWTSMPEGKYNLHRNVIFGSDQAPAPFTALDSKRPEDLWRHLDHLRSEGYEVIAIPHNANASGGRMFDWVKSDGRPIDFAYAQQRAMNEPLVEIVQIKGQSETVPELSANDEFAGFEVMDRLMTTLEPSEHHGSYVRETLGRGLIVQQKVGANPFKLGVVGGSDIHNGLSTSAENAFAGSNEGVSPDRLPGKETAVARIGPYVAVDVTANRKRDFRGAPPFLLSSGGLTGVWAEENTRPSIFAALRRKETFATSGTRLRIRMFGGWTYAETMLRDPDWLATAYAAGVPMGSDLPVRPSTSASPSFLVVAAKDPKGANLDRIQIVKVWGEGDDVREQVFDVALSGDRRVEPGSGRARPVGDTVDRKTGKYENSIGAPMLSAYWTDPTFDKVRPAVYYARALEIPTPRWSTLLAVRYGLPLPSDKPATLQERAWSSAIWYSPD